MSESTQPEKHDYKLISDVDRYLHDIDTKLVSFAKHWLKVNPTTPERQQQFQYQTQLMCEDNVRKASTILCTTLDSERKFATKLSVIQDNELADAWELADNILGYQKVLLAWNGEVYGRDDTISRDIYINLSELNPRDLWFITEYSTGLIERIKNNRS